MTPPPADAEPVALGHGAVRDRAVVRWRGRARYAFAASWIVFSAVVLVTGLSGFAGSDGVGPSGLMWTLGGLSLAAAGIALAYRHLVVGVDAAHDEVRVRYAGSSRAIAWAEVIGVELHRLDPDGSGPTLQVLAFRLVDGDVVASAAPAGRAGRGRYLDRQRERLVAMRDAARRVEPPSTGTGPPPRDRPPPGPT